MNQKLYNFEKLATMAIERELRKHAVLVKDYELGITVFTTEHVPEEQKRTVTVWFEVKTDYPLFWDIKPVIIVYHNHDLYLKDICDRTAEYFEDTVKRLNRRFMRQFVPKRI